MLNIAITWLLLISNTNSFVIHDKTILKPRSYNHAITRNNINININIISTRRSSAFTRYTTATATTNDNKIEFQKDEVILGTSKSLLRISWLSWWTQIILSTISTVTLLFTKSVLSSKPKSGLYLASSGIVLSYLSTLWIWATGARLAKRLVRRGSITRINAANMIRKTLSVGVMLNLIGMFITIIGAEQIVGALAAKVLTSSSTQGFFLQPSSVTSQILQPIDILVVQANTNTLLSHFCSLFLLLSLVKWIDRLDPPSSNELKRDS